MVMDFELLGLTNKEEMRVQHLLFFDRSPPTLAFATQMKKRLFYFQTKKT